MKQLQFLIANILSGFAWSIVYVSPGMLVGAASAELSPEGATRLFVFILFILFFIWLLSISIRWLLTKAHGFLRVKLHSTWLWLENNKYCSYITHRFTPPNEGNHATTAALALFTLLSIAIIASIVSWFAFVDELGDLLDLPIYFFFQSVRTQWFDTFFVFIACFVNFYSLFLFWTALSIHFIHVRNWRSLRYWMSLGFTSFFFTQALGVRMNQLRLQDAPLFQSTFSFPSTTLAVATALFAFLSFQIKHTRFRHLAYLFKLVFGCLFILDGFALLYLGDHWATSILISYAMGACACFIHWLFYRRYIPKSPPSLKAIYFSLAIFLLSSLWITSIQFKTILQDHYPYPEQYVLTSHAWWHQREPLLPIYTMNRFGQPNGVFNIQYLGSLDTLKKALEAEGWKQRPNSFKARLLSHAKRKTTKTNDSFSMPLYLNKKPILIMTHEPEKNYSGLALSLWASNYHLRSHDEPIWLGSLQPYPNPPKKQLRIYRFKQAVMQGAFSPFHQLLPALEAFEFNTLPLPAQSFKSLSSTPYPLLLIIKEKP